MPAGGRVQPSAASAPGVDGGTGDVPCASGESVMLKTEKRLKPSLQLMPIINPAVPVVSQNITWSVCANTGYRVKKHQTRENPPHAELIPSLSSRTPRCRPPSSLFTKVTFVKSSRAGFSMLKAQQLPVQQ